MKKKSDRKRHTRLRRKPGKGQGLGCEAGFSLAEVLVSLVVFTQIILMALLLFDFNSRVTRVQTRVAEMQQSLRVGHGEIVRMIRMAGRSGLPATAPTGPVATTSFPPASVAISVLNNVTGAARRVVPSLADGPEAMAGSDILVLRGNFSNSYYRAQIASLNGDRSTATAGTIIVQNNAAVVNRANFTFPLPENDLGSVIQDLTQLREANDPSLRGADPTDTIPEALLLVPSTPGVGYAVLELVPAVGNNGAADSVTLSFRISSASGTDIVNDYRALWTNDPNTLFPLEVGSGCYIAILEEYRFYVRNDGGATAESARPRLSRARLLPGTALPYGNPDDDPDDLVLRTDIADQILDLQVAIGLDTTAGGQIGRAELGTIGETANGVGDDWLYNAAADNPAAPAFTVFDEAQIPRLYFLRVSTLARTAGQDPEGEDHVIPALEDRVYPAAAGLVNSDTARKYRRRTLQTVVDLRNL